MATASAQRHAEKPPLLTRTTAASAPATLKLPREDVGASAIRTWTSPTPVDSDFSQASIFAVAMREPSHAKESTACLLWDSTRTGNRRAVQISTDAKLKTPECKIKRKRACRVGLLVDAVEKHKPPRSICFVHL